MNSKLGSWSTVSALVTLREGQEAQGVREGAASVSSMAGCCEFRVEEE